MSIATPRMAMLNGVQAPWYQCATALYHSSVDGRKIKPRIGQMMFGNTPLNQPNSHSTKTANRGVTSATISSRQGIVDPCYSENSFASSTHSPCGASC